MAGVEPTLVAGLLLAPRARISIRPCTLLACRANRPSLDAVQGRSRQTRSTLADRVAQALTETLGARVNDLQDEEGAVDGSDARVLADADSIAYWLPNSNSLVSQLKSFA
jgi:hypothetical protein